MKSVLARQRFAAVFLNQLPHNTQIAFILNPCLDDIELLQAICRELEIPFSDDASLRILIDSIYQRLLQNHQQGINTVLLIDEAQQMYQKTLELIRLLTNLETDTQKLLKIILVGQPELNDLLARAELLQLSQRITARYHIKPLSVDELRYYVQNRLTMAGYQQKHKLFSTARIKQLFSLTQGIPRVVNVICDRALLGAYSGGASAISQRILNKAYEEVNGHDNNKSSTTNRFYLWFFVVACVIFSLAAANHYANINWWQSVNTLMSPKPTVLVVPDVVLDSHIQKDVIEKAPQLVQEVVDDTPLTLPDFLMSSEEKAWKLFFEDLMTKQKNINHCRDLANVDWRCDTESVTGWLGFKQINRPSIMRLIKDGAFYFLPLVAVKDIYGTVLSRDQETNALIRHQIPLVELGEYWTGEFIYVWQVPVGFERFIYKDSAQDQVDWLSGLFAQLDDQSRLLSEGRYNSRLQKRVEIFQRQQGLKEDGKAGIQTLLKLHEMVGIAITLETDVWVKRMSYILESLKKSDKKRRDASGTDNPQPLFEFVPDVVVQKKSQIPVPLLVLVGAVLFVLAAVWFVFNLPEKKLEAPLLPAQTVPPIKVENLRLCWKKTCCIRRDFCCNKHN